MAERQKGIVLDTNWYVSATINRKSRRILHHLLTDSKLQIFYSRELLDEYYRVISRPKFKNQVTLPQVNRFMRLVLPMLSLVKVKSAVQRSRDVKDNFVLSLAKDAKAKYIVTGDLDLLVLKKYEKTRIVTIAEFLKLMDGSF